MREFREFLKAVFFHWEWLVSGVVASIYFWIIDQLYAQGSGTEPRPWYIYVLSAFLFAFYGCYRAWRDKNRSLQDARQQIAAFAIQLEDEVDDAFQEVVAGPGAPLSPFARLAHLQSQVRYLWIELEKPAPERKPALIKKLARNLKQQRDLEAHPRPAGEGTKQYYDIIGQFERLKRQVKVGPGLCRTVYSSQKVTFCSHAIT